MWKSQRGRSPPGSARRKPETARPQRIRHGAATGSGNDRFSAVAGGVCVTTSSYPARRVSMRHHVECVSLYGRDAMKVPLTPLRCLHRAVDLYGSKQAIVCGNKRFTYAQFGERCEKLASALTRNGVRREDRVAYLSFNTHRLL